MTPAFLDRLLDQIPFALRAQSIEWVGVICFTRDQISPLRVIAEGDRKGAEFYPAELFQKIEGEGFILVHNHPSGCLEPSEVDRQLTLKIRRVCARKGLRFEGHGIITRRGETMI